MDEITKNAFRLIAASADAAFEPPGAHVENQTLLVLSLIEGQCRVLRKVHGDGDGLDPSEEG